MMINDLVAALEKVPPMVAAGWIAWLITGALLSRWSVYERNRVVAEAPAPRHKSGVRAPRQPKTVPFSAGDAFGELEAMLDEKPSGVHRIPGESATPAMTEPPVLTNSAGAPALAAPRSLP
jgi:hypothetical protein